MGTVYIPLSVVDVCAVFSAASTDWLVEQPG